MDEIQYMPVNMLTVIKKLPYKLRDKWRTLACDIQERRHHRTTFPDIVGFIECQVKISADPVVGNIQDTPKQCKAKMAAKRINQHCIQSKGSCFSTTVTSVDEKAHRRKEGGSLDKTAFLYGKGRHTLELYSLLYSLLERRE